MPGQHRSYRITRLVFCAALLALAMLLIPSALYGTGKGHLRVAFINVGHGDSIWLHSSDQTDILSSTIPVQAVIYNGQPYSDATYLEFVGAMQAHNLTPTPAAVGQSYRRAGYLLSSVALCLFAGSHPITNIWRIDLWDSSLWQVPLTLHQGRPSIGFFCVLRRILI